MTDPLADAVATLLREVGDSVILPRFGTLTKSDIDTKSGPSDLVTVADYEAENWLTPRLRALVDCPVIGEEACARTPAILDAACDRHAWTVDPVDGTSNFVKGDDRFCSMIALLENGFPVASWIWMPFAQELYYAADGAGAFRITATSRSPLVAAPTQGDVARMTGGGNALGITEPEATRIRDALRRLPGRVFLGSAGVLGAEIASGKTHFLFHGKCTPWDHAPVELLCREAGAHAAMLSDAARFSADRTDPILITPTTNDWQQFSTYVRGGTST